MGKKLFLIRHGQTDWNFAHKYQGQCDIPLNKTGISQALSVASQLADENIDGIFSSDLQRAAVTAEKIAQYHQDIELKTMPALREIDFGQWEGLKYQEIEKEYPIHLKKWLENPVEITPPGGESLLELQTRVISQVEEICQENQGNNLVLVTHGGVIRALLTYILHMSVDYYWKIEVVHCAITIVKYYDGEFILSSLNCCSGKL
ncbi:alpha-ribazole phosphatase [Halocella sp. SP3-1]|uniref:alpha-ribazole phosphatase n=1 Tax=Halocella sp. SP3-1 TaxID=2382161 RepID=UPI000F75B962|nr:alpha-ribazole phosphatase [Halocella sp. SP3-1]AZO95911.1 alpha-ribazole phosphatase [Halocella sp. SP3-1]